ncbi:MAG: hypothetical protein HYV26_12995 [Candidatus Hydrogenedentes bacterium]|nr:hypothetical protein [Candidatus Hydrogenedentota bacterium]
MAEDGPKLHPKSIRRKLLKFLYDRYLDDPLEMLVPEDFFEHLPDISRRELIPNIHYLGDRRYVELMMGYNPPMFAAARITATGIDLVENCFEFNLRFPPAPGHEEEAAADLPHLVERLVEEADFSPLDGEERHALLRDVQFLRDELARPVHRWRRRVIEAVLYWITGSVENAEEILPAAVSLQQRVREVIDAK